MLVQFQRLRYPLDFAGTKWTRHIARYTVSMPIYTKNKINKVLRNYIFVSYASNIYYNLNQQVAILGNALKKCTYIFHMTFEFFDTIKSCP